MRVIARGWKRDCGENIVMNADFDFGVEQWTGTFEPDVTYTRRRSNGNIEVSSGPTTMTLGGKYQTVLSISKQELLTLVAEAFHDDAFSLVVSELAEAFSSLNGMNVGNNAGEAKTY